MYMPPGYFIMEQCVLGCNAKSLGPEVGNVDATLSMHNVIGLRVPFLLATASAATRRSLQLLADITKKHSPDDQQLVSFMEAIVAKMS